MTAKESKLTLQACIYNSEHQKIHDLALQNPESKAIKKKKKTGFIMSLRRHCKEEKLGRGCCLLPLYKTQRAWSFYFTIWKLTLQHKRENPNSCVKTLDDCYLGASLVKCNFRALSVISNKILPLGLRRWELSSFFLWIWLKWAKKWSF